MQIVIDIPDKAYKEVKHDIPENLNHTPYELIAKSIRNGTLIPKGHGRLIDADELEPDTEWDDYEDGFISYSRNQIKCANVIIPADKESD